MNLKDLTVLSFSYGRNLFDPENLESKRMQRSAEIFASMDTIVFTLRTDQLLESGVGNLRLHPTHSRHRFFYLFDALRIGWRVLRQRGNHWVIVAQDPFELGFIGLALSWWYRVPLCVQEHGDFYSRQYWAQAHWSNALRAYLGLFVLRRADTVRAVSARIAQALRDRGIPGERIFTLPVRTDVFDAPPIRDEVAIKGSRGEGDLTILTMARLVPQKNLPLLIDAFAEVVRVVPVARLQIVGKGPLASFLEARVKLHGIQDYVTFIPWTENPRHYLEAADVYALSSDWEGWARVLIEAMQVAVPVVTTDVGCAGEVLKDGIHGIVVPPRDEGAFAKALQTLLLNSALRTQFGEAARRDVATTHQTADVYALEQARILEATYHSAQKS